MPVVFLESYEPTHSCCLTECSHPPRLCDPVSNPEFVVDDSSSFVSSESDVFADSAFVISHVPRALRGRRRALHRRPACKPLSYSLLVLSILHVLVYSIGVQDPLSVDFFVRENTILNRQVRFKSLVDSLREIVVGSTHHFSSASLSSASSSSYGTVQQQLQLQVQEQLPQQAQLDKYGSSFPLCVRDTRAALKLIGFVFSLFYTASFAGSTSSGSSQKKSAAAFASFN